VIVQRSSGADGNVHLLEELANLRQKN
jgi:hypothetical protein